MDLQAQVQALIDEAPPDLDMQAIRVVAEVLGEVAQGLVHPQYYLLRNLAQQWQVTTLQHRDQPNRQKTVLYAYGNLSDATSAGQAADLMAVPMPTVQLLFHFFSFGQVDSLLFLDEVNRPDQMRELKHLDLQSLVRASLEQQVMEQALDKPFGDIA
ncbi:MAG: hypothetical protein WCD18_05820 [Thermosynechococcaceae cyanobacterium]